MCLNPHQFLFKKFFLFIQYFTFTSFQMDLTKPRTSWNTVYNTYIIVLICSNYIQLMDLDLFFPCVQCFYTFALQDLLKVHYLLSNFPLSFLLYVFSILKTSIFSECDILLNYKMCLSYVYKHTCKIYIILGKYEIIWFLEALLNNLGVICLTSFYTKFSLVPQAEGPSNITIHALFYLYPAIPLPCFLPT